MLDNFKLKRDPGSVTKPHLILAVALLVIGWLAYAGVADARRPVTQQERLTPIQREIERQGQRLSSTDAEERRDALMHLANLKRPEASRAAAAALNDEIPAVRVAAVHAILSLPHAEAANLIFPLLKDKNEFVRREAAFALGESRSRAATTAARALTIPTPQFAIVQLESAGKGDAVDVSSARSCGAVRLGATARTSDATPETIGVERLVPAPLAQSSAPGTVVPVFHRIVMPSSALTAVSSPPGAETVMPAPELL